MNGNIYKSAGITIGIFIGLILAVALILIANNNRKFKTEYDERQLRVRGDAYRYAFYSVIICEVILLILSIGEFTLPIPEYVLHFGGIRDHLHDRKQHGDAERLEQAADQDHDAEQEELALLLFVKDVVQFVEEADAFEIAVGCGRTVFPAAGQPAKDG